MNNEPSLSLSQANIPIPEKWGRTEMMVNEFSYTWTIKNFSFCREGMGPKITSPIFSIGDNNEIKGILTLYLDGYGEGAPDYLSLFVKLVSCKEPVRDVIRAFMEVRTPTIHQIKSKRVRFPISTFSFPKQELGFAKFIDKKLLDDGNDLPNDELTILCRGSASIKIVKNSGEFKSIPSTVADCHVLDDLGEFLENENFSDVLLNVNGQEYKAHKVILAAQSPVFAAMFNHKMMEQQQNCVNITDIEHDVFSEMLKFLYTGKVPNLRKMAIGLLSASDKYNISKLKAMCENTLALSIKTENVVDILIVADLHHSDQLKSQAIQFVAQNITNVRNTASFKSMICSYPHLLGEVLVHLR